MALVRDFMGEFLAEFSTNVLGVVQHHVTIQVPNAQFVKLKIALFEKRDHFVFDGKVLVIGEVESDMATPYADGIPAVAPIGIDHPSASEDAVTFSASQPFAQPAVFPTVRN